VPDHFRPAWDPAHQLHEQRQQHDDDAEHDEGSDEAVEARRLPVSGFRTSWDRKDDM
jgi:hypothetical protein